MKSARIKLNIVNIITFFLTIIIIFAGSRAIGKLEHSINDLSISSEKQWRSQAKSHIEKTIHTFNNDIDSGYVDPYDDDSVAEWARKNYTGFGGSGLYSNSWVGEIGSDAIIDDQCISRMVIKDLDNEYKRIISDSFSYDSINDDQIEKIIDLIKEGVPPKNSDKIYYDVNGYREWIEFNYYPLFGGIGGEHKTVFGKSNDAYKRYVFVLSAKSSDISKQYSKMIEEHNQIIILVYIIMVAACLFSIILMSVLFYRYVDTN